MGCTTHGIAVAMSMLVYLLTLVDAAGRDPFQLHYGELESLSVQFELPSNRFLYRE